MSPNTQIEQIELSIEHARKIVANRDDLRKLGTNRQFRRIIEEGYCRDEAVRLTGLLADPTMAAHRKDIEEALAGISHFLQYLQNLERLGTVMEGTIADHEEALQEIQDEIENGEA